MEKSFRRSDKRTRMGMRDREPRDEEKKYFVLGINIDI
jgi:hypothetical protein